MSVSVGVGGRGGGSGLTGVYPQTQRRTLLTVADVVKLATAGVKIEFSDIADQLQPDAPPATGEPALADAIWERWHRAKTATRTAFHFDGHHRPWQLFAAQHGDTIHVFVSPNDAEPFVFTDVAAIYPSDALMAALALHERTK